MTGELPLDNGIPRQNGQSAIEDALNALRDTPDERCIRATHPFGTVKLRYDSDTDCWFETHLMPTVAGPPTWTNEQSIFPQRRYALLAHAAFSVEPIDEYPH